MVHQVLKEVPVVASALPEDVRALLAEALPADERAAVEEFGFHRIDDETPGLRGHHYLEAYFHALYDYQKQTALSVHPRFPFHRPLERQPAPAPITAFCEALRRCNKAGLERLASRLRGPRVEPLRLALELGAHFADVSVQIHWGEAVGPRHAAWHRDACYSALHLAVSLRGARTLLAQRQLRANDRDERLPQQQGDVYLSAPFYFFHAVEYPAVSWDSRTVSMQCRFLLKPDVLAALQREMETNESVHTDIMEYLAGCSLVMPSLEEVQIVAAELRERQPTGGPASPRALSSTATSPGEPAPAGYQEDLAMILSAMREDGAALEYEEQDIRADYDIVLTAVTQRGLALEFASEELRAMPDIALAAVQQDAAALRFAAAPLRADRAFGLAAVAADARALRHLAPELWADREIILTAVNQDGLLLRFAVARLRADREVAMTAVKQRGLALRYLHQELRADPAVVLLAARQDIQLTRYAAGDLKARAGLLAGAGPAAGAGGGAGAGRRRGRFSVQLDVTGADPASGASGSRAPRAGGGAVGGAGPGQAASPAPATAPPRAPPAPRIGGGAGGELRALGARPPDLAAGAGAGAQRPPVGKCYMVGTWDDFRDRREMSWDGEAYRMRIEIARGRDEESFQLLLGWWDRRLYPSIPDASPQRPHEVLGPDGNERRAHGKNWTLRRGQGAGHGGRLCFDVSLVVSERSKFRVGWERVT